MTRVGAGCVLVGMGCVQINGEDGDGWAYGCSGVAALPVVTLLRAVAMVAAATALVETAA